MSSIVIIGNRPDVEPDSIAVAVLRDRPRARAIATSKVVSTARASPSARSTRRDSASGSALNPSTRKARSASSRRSAGVSASNRQSVERLSSGAFSAKKGFSVVAPTRTITPSSTPDKERVLLSLV